MIKSKAKLIIDCGSGARAVEVSDVTDFNRDSEFISFETSKGLIAFATRTVLRVGLSHDVQ